MSLIIIINYIMYKQLVR